MDPVQADLIQCKVFLENHCGKVMLMCSQDLSAQICFYIPTPEFYESYLKYCSSSSLLAEPVTKRAMDMLGAVFERQAQTNLSSHSRELKSHTHGSSDLTAHQKLEMMVEFKLLEIKFHPMAPTHDHSR